MLAILLLLAQSAGGSAGDVFLAPPDCWTTRGGGPARSGAALTRPVRGPVDIAWTHDAGGDIEGEPLVWHDLVVISVRMGTDQRVLRALDLSNGAVLAGEVTRSALPLEPSLWRNVVVFRRDSDQIVRDSDQIVALRVGGHSMTTVWKHRADRRLGAPLLDRNEIYVASRTELSKFVLGRHDPVWTVQGAFDGEVALAPDGIRAVRFEELGEGVLSRIDPSSGLEREHAYLGHFPKSAYGIALSLLQSASFLHVSVPFADGGTRILAVGPGSEAEGRTTASAMTSLPTPVGRGWIARMLTDKGMPVLALSEKADSKQVQVLASRATLPRLFEDEQPATVCGSVAYVGAFACDLETRRVLWRIDGVQPSERAVPARETVLYVDRGKRLVAVRARTTRGHAFTSEATNQPVQGTMVLRDGSIETGEFALDPAGQRVQRTRGRAEFWPFADILMLEDAEQHIVLAGEPLRALELLAESARSEGYLALAKRARQANSPQVLEELLDQALAHGADEKETEPLRAVVEKLRRSTAKVNEAIVSTVSAETVRISRLPVTVVWQRARVLPEGLRPHLETKLLRRVLELDPGHAEALERVRALFPEGLQLQGRLDPLDALTLIDTLRRTRVEFVGRPVEGARDVPFEQREIGKRLPLWRNDLHAIRSDDLLIVTPVREPGTLARCLALGELVCKALAELFAEGTVARDARYPMVIELYPTREDYLAHAARGGADLSWTAGLYDMRENLTRLYMPPAQDTSHDLLATIAHELTHHWLRMRCPAWPFRSLSGNPGDFEQPGFWIVEGFASFIEEFSFDLDNGTWSPGGAVSPRLDLVANAADTQRIPWAAFLAVSEAGFQSLPNEGQIDVPSSIYLGLRQRATTRNVFYAQAAATARYLYEAQDGKLRPKLFAFLHAYYTGDRVNLDLAHVLGVEAGELGRQVVTHAHEVLAGAL
jgi:hypothetical protein